MTDTVTNAVTNTMTDTRTDTMNDTSTLTMRTPSPNGSHPPADGARPDRRGFRPTARRRNRMLAGGALAALAVAGNVWLYANLGDEQSVLQVVRDVPAGEEVTADAVRAVAVDLDASVPSVPADQLGAVVGTYAKVRLVAGSLVTTESLQATPLVAAGSSVVAILVPDGSLPIGLRERAPVDLVLSSRSATPNEDGGPPTVVTGRVVGLPATPESAVGVVSLSVQVPQHEAATVAAAESVRVVLREPTPDEAAGGS